MEGQGKYYLIWGFFMLFSVSCTYYKNEIYIPPVSEETSTLQAEYVAVAPNSINSAYWVTADYLAIDPGNITVTQVSEGDGLLNVNNMYNGLTDFNGGQAANLTLKAAYDDTYLYILAEWMDTTFDVSQGNWFYNGPNDPNKSSDTLGWTSQLSDDKLIIEFENGTSKDIWKWSLAVSEPMGCAIDMYDNGSGWMVDAGDKSFVRNVAGEGYRAGPKYEWGGEQQTITRDPGGLTILDPGYFLMDTTNFVDDVVNGEYLFQNKCAACHGKNGYGDGVVQNTGVALNVKGWFNRYSREGLDNLISNEERHSIGARFWTILNEEQQLDLGARLKAFSGVPGYYLENPSGSVSDVKALSNVALANINVEKKNKGYKVLLIRKLQTGNSDDIQFNPDMTGTYGINIYLSDNDDLNLIGMESEELTFK